MPASRTTHGASGYRNGNKRIGRTPLYRIWACMKTRCSNPNIDRAAHYFHKGIRVCAEWQDFIAFRDWAMTNGYHDGLSIDRIDNDKGYSPDNCRWVTKASQHLNQTSNVRLTAFGETKTLTEWSKDDRCAVCHSTLNDRIRKGVMSHEEAISKPPK